VTRTASSRATLATLRALLLWILLLGLLGTGTELILIGHDEDRLQFIPLAALAVSIVAAAWMAVKRPTAPGRGTRLFQAAMVQLIVVGAAGSVIHYRANMEFKLEMDPSMRGFRLFSSVMRAKAPPALAPGNLSLLGLLGLAAVFRQGAEHSP
jgi:hypothetical protein